MRYSNRSINGLPVPKERKVNHLSKFISLFSTGQYTNCLFRGEPTNYFETTSSAIRDTSLCLKDSTTKHPFIKMKEDFKREVWHKLTQDERSHFLAFSQHHGIPTNLIDITTSPLIALYFACQPYNNVGDFDFDEERGYVNVFADTMVDITNIIAKNENDNILELYARNRNDILLDFYDIFLTFESKHPLEFYQYLRKLNADYHYHFGRGLDKSPIPKKIIPYKDGEYKSKVWEWLYNFIDDKNKYILTQIENKYGIISYEVLIYILYLQRFLLRIIDYREPIWWFNIMPNFKYAPILSFDRGRNQQGLFIYQTYLSFVESVYDAEIVAKQRVWPNEIIVIENKEQILKELDFIGINKKFVYGDYDSIASYIKNKY